MKQRLIKNSPKLIPRVKSTRHVSTQKKLKRKYMPLAYTPDFAEILYVIVLNTDEKSQEQHFNFIYFRKFDFQG